MMPFKFRTFRGRDEHIPGMNEVKAMVKEADIKYTAPNGRIFSWSSVFVSWETDEVRVYIHWRHSRSPPIVYESNNLFVTVSVSR